MHKILIYSLLFAGLCCLGACALDEGPTATYSELTIGGADSTGTEVKYSTREEMLTQYEGMYNMLKGNNGLEKWSLDFLVVTDTHSDNAYRGATDAELTQLEQQKQNGINKNIQRDWDAFFNMIAATNRVICNVDSVPDPALSIEERKQWKAEALILRSWIMFDMVRLWGGIPLILEEPPVITAENIDQVYPLYYPARSTKEEVYAQIVKDLNAALEPGGAPDMNPTDKFVFSRTVAYGLLAKVYAEPTIRDYSLTVQYSTEVEKDVSLLPNYADLFALNDLKTDVKYRHSAESIFEIPFSDGGNWNTWMFGIDATDPNSTYDWAKWLTPSRDLIAAFDQEGDVIRKKASIVFASVDWSNHYPSDNYPHMHKYPSRFNSIIKMRLADILLLKAEALVELGNLSEAAELVNMIRGRVNLPALSSTVTASETAMAEAVLNERRLELAFEGQRWFDLVRTGKIYEVMNTLNARDEGRMIMDEVSEFNILLPLPQSQIDINPNLIQNEGY